ncbi:MAG: phytoene desaturase [Anaerolineae bacterium]|nr:phytoene desaturase [Anaerolineae bacterium]
MHISESAPLVVIGAGLGGLSAAIHLVAAGERVVILEQNTAVGGKMSLLQADGFTWDCGPSVITMRPALENLFAAAGRRLADYVTLSPVAPLTRYFYPDGTVFDATRDLPDMLRQIAAFAPHDVEGYLAFLSHAAALHRVAGQLFIYNDPPTLASAFGIPLRDVLKVDIWRTMHGAHRTYVRSPKLQQLLGRFATYVGGSPYQTSAVYNVIAHVELSDGIWYPQGGAYQLARAYQRLAEELGVEIRTGSRVTGITVKEGCARGVSLADGDYLEARAVIANVDVTTVYRELLPPEIALRRRRSLSRIEPSGSGFALLLGIEGTFPALAQHNIFFSSDYRREFEALFRRRIVPREATIYVTATSKADPEHAPEGCENWFVLVNAPPIGPEFDWELEAGAVADAILAQLADYGYDVRSRLRCQYHLTPRDIAEHTGAWRGALYGLSPNDPLNVLRRPINRASEVRSLYFAGGTTHPGGGVPMVTLSGGVAARMALADLLKAD